MNRDPDEAVTERVAREIAARRGFTAVMTGSIASLGSQYVLTLNAVNAQNGENLASTQAEASSLDALKAFTRANLRRAEGREPESIPYFERAIELDPNFAMAHARLSVVHQNLGHYKRASEYARRAYELRDRVSERERYYIVARYARAKARLFRPADHSANPSCRRMPS